MTHTDSNPILIAKRAAGMAAADLIQDGMTIGLGTGSTAAFFIEALAEKCRSGLKISAVATSRQSFRQAEKLGIPMIPEDSVTFLDVTVDGADEIDQQKNMIKGGGGALLREKLLAMASKEMIVVIDETKLVDFLGNHPLPVEIIPFVYKSTIQRLRDLGYQGILRLNRSDEPLLTDNGNYIFDIQYSGPMTDPREEHQRLKAVTGVVETGLFFNLAHKVVMGYVDGLTKIYS